MNLIPLKIPGAYRIELEPLEDERGLFARTFCLETLRRHGIEFPVIQCSLSTNRATHTLRGMHVQISPCPEKKIVRCTAGRVWDCILDLRPGSPAFKQWIGVELSAANRTALLIPEQCAHGFLTLEPDSEVFYMMSDPFAPEYARGVRWNDPAFAIDWPDLPRVLSEKDQQWPDFTGELL
ncbi:MAG: dTDP-4-keto-6-deoxy-D-glucose epimerase [Lentisphaerae bacterium]|nr:dTDP-4-keto-6-deoxy-D-glucose epimerase [Lentisphaerota bacterium]